MKTRDFLADLASKRSTELEELAKRVEALEKIGEESEDEEELKAADTELDELNAKKAELEKELEEINAQIAELDKPNEEENKQRNKFNFMTKESRGIKTMNIEERKANAEKFAETRKATYGAEETRAVLVSSGTIATPTEVDGINDGGFVRVSSILDLVKVVNCEGMGANKVAYLATDAVANAQTEGGAITTSDPTFGFVTITPESIAVLSAISKQTRKQSPLQYEAKVKESAMIGLRRTAAQKVTSHIVGSTMVDKQTISALDHTAVRKIAFNYGGSEGVEGEAWLVLNKADLVTLGDARGTNDKKPVYEIIPDTTNPNTGVIKDGGLTVKYCIDSNLTVGTMIYGNLKNVEVDLFSKYEIAVSEDFYFDKLMDAIRGDVELGCGVIAKNGVNVITVGA